MKLYFTRHGETVWNVENKICGASDSPLTEKGREQARQLGERAELKAEYQYRYDVINEYAPKLMSAEEIESLLKEKFAEVIATKNKGQIMKEVMPALKGKADGKLINTIVAELCK